MTEPKFEFKPAFNVNKPQTFKQLVEISKKRQQSLRYRIQELGLRTDKNSISKGKFSVKDSNLILNNPRERINWNIVGYVNVSETATSCNVVQSTVQAYIIRNNIPILRKDLGHDGTIWVEDQYAEVIRNSVYPRFIRHKMFQEKKKKKQKKSLSIDELKKLHPLVKDVRCFSFSWWPDDMPVQFKNMEEV